MGNPGEPSLRTGYTTGSCAAAASMASALMLFTGNEVHQVSLLTPIGKRLNLDIEDIRIEAHSVSCAVRKDSGDDPDVTNGVLIYAKVSPSDIAGVKIHGGKGVGRVTKPGLDQPVGEAAINSTPRRMIRSAIEEALSQAQANLTDSTLPKGVDVEISIPLGEELAKKTFNPKLGIVGGISVLGTTGIVKPMSDQALLDTIQVEINVRRAENIPILPVTPGNYGQAFIQETYGFSLDAAVTSSNFIKDTAEKAAAADFKRLLFVGHIGKLVKVAGGIPNTHSRYGDHRMEILARLTQEVIRDDALKSPAETGTFNACGETAPFNACGETAPFGPCGETSTFDSRGETAPFGPCRKTSTFDSRGETAAAAGQEAALKNAIMDCISTDEAVRVLKEARLSLPVMQLLTQKVKTQLETWTHGRLNAEVIVFSNVHGLLGQTPKAKAYIEELLGFFARRVQI